MRFYPLIMIVVQSNSDSACKYCLGLLENQMASPRQVQNRSTSKSLHKALILGILFFASASIVHAQSVVPISSTTDGTYTIQTLASTEGERLYTINDGNSNEIQLSQKQILIQFPPEKWLYQCMKNVYLSSDGAQGTIKVPVRDLPYLNTSIDYTIGMWIKSKSTPLADQDLSLFEIEGSLQCQVSSALNALACESQGKRLFGKGLSNLAPYQYTWLHVLVKGQAPNTTVGESMLFVSRNGNTNSIIQTQVKYLPVQQIQRPFQVCLFGCKSPSNFSGSLREFLFLSANVGTQQALTIKNSIVLWNTKMLGYFRFESGQMDYYRKERIQVSGTVRMEKDYTPNDVCNAFTKESIHYYFDDKTQLLPISVDQRWQPKQKGWQYSVSLTVYLDLTSCHSEDPQFIDECHLVHIQDGFSIFSPMPNELQVIFNNAPIAQRIRSQSIFIPYNQWLTIQFTVEQYSGYILQVYDILGELVSQTSEKRDLQPQNIKNKTISLLGMMRGFARQVYISTERALSMPFNTKENYTVKDNCLMQLEFAYPNGLVNKCNHSMYGEIKAKMVGNSISAKYWEQYPFNSGKTVGKFNTTNSNFDGTACNDGNQMVTINSTQSAIMTEIANQSLTAMTVELWFKQPSSQSNQSQYILQAWSTTAKQEIMSISHSISSQLLCKAQSSQVALASYSSSLGWVHVTCSIDQAIIKSILYRRDLVNATEDTYTSQTVGNFSTSLENIQLYLGNSMAMNQGTPQLLVRELRMWNNVRSENEIKEYRHKQVLISGVSGLQLYIRFSEGSLKELNLIQPQSALTFTGVTLIETIDKPIICPISTYYDSDAGVCYKDPVQEVYAFVYPGFQGENNTQTWVFDASLTGLNFPSASPSLNYQWNFGSDALIAKYSNIVATSSIVQIPAKLFRDEIIYPISVTVSNIEKTFSKTKEIKFLPISCQHYSTNASTQMTGPLSVDDISFILNLQSQTTYCKDVTFFNTLLMDKLTISVVPNLKLQPKILVQKLSDTQILLTIPKSEQYKLDIGRSSLNFVIDLKYTNQLYSANLNSTSLTFQNVIHTLKLPSLLQGSETLVQPVLRILNEDGIVLKGQSAMLDGSDSYVIGKTGSAKYENLTFHWLCEAELTTFCLNRTGPYLTIKPAEFTGRFDIPYQIALRVEYRKESGVKSSFKVSQNVTFLSIARPEFIITTNLSSILVSKDKQDINIAFKDSTIKANDYTILWTLDPPISSTDKAINNGTAFTLLKGSLQPLTTYTLTVQAYHTVRSKASYTLSQTFTTKSPPTNGTLTLSPLYAVEGIQTNFSLGIKGWESTSPPIQLRVSQVNQTQTNLIVFSVLTIRVNVSGWVTLEEDEQRVNGSTFKFSVTTNRYPILVELRDATNEVYSQLFDITEKQIDNSTEVPPIVNNTNETANISNETGSNSNQTGNNTSEAGSNSNETGGSANETSSNSNETGNNTSEAGSNNNETGNNTNEPETNTNGTVANQNETQNNQTQDNQTLPSNSTGETQPEQNQTESNVTQDILSETKKSLQLTTGDKFSQTEIDAKLEANELRLSELAQNLSSILNSPLSTPLSFEILQELLKSISLYTADPMLVGLSGISNAQYILYQTSDMIFGFTKDQISAIQKLQVQLLGNVKIYLMSRTAKTSPQYKQVKKDFDQVQNILFFQLCPEIGDSKPSLYVTPQMDLYIKRTEKSGSDYSVGATIDERLVIDEDQLVDFVGPNQCYYSIIYQSRYLTTSLYSPLSDTVFEYGLINSLKAKMKYLQTFTTIQYRAISMDVDQSHIYCMGYKDLDWNATLCQTNIVCMTETSISVDCHCSSPYTETFGLFTNNLYSKEARMSALENAAIQRRDQNLIMTYGVIGVSIAFFSLLAGLMKVLDIKDEISLVKLRLTTTEQSLKQKLSKQIENENCSQEDAFLIQDTLRYSSSSLLATLLYRSHPITNLFGLYSSEYSRLKRFCVSFLQHQVLLAIIVAQFKKNDHGNNWHRSEINDSDYSVMTSIFFMGLAILMPFEAIRMIFNCRSSMIAKVFSWTSLTLLIGGLFISSHTTLLSMLQLDPFVLVPLISTLLGTSLACSFALCPLLYSIWNAALINKLRSKQIPCSSCLISRELQMVSRKIEVIKQALQEEFQEKEIDQQSDCLEEEEENSDRDARPLAIDSIKLQYNSQTRL